MIKPLIELVLLAVMVGTVQASGTMPVEARDQVVRRLPEITEAAMPREAVVRAQGLPEVEARGTWPKLIDPASLGVLVTAGSAIVVDRDGGKLLFEKDADRVRPIASITKLMTALVFLEHNVPQDNIITITEEDVGDGVSTIFAEEDRVSVRDVFSAMLIGSANDAARALARTTGIDEAAFVRRMNERGRELGMTQTRFVEPTGLDSRNVSTARELTALVQAARLTPSLSDIVRQPVYRTTGSTKKSQFVRSTDLLLSSFLNQFPYRIALAKTGSLDDAGFCFVASVDRGEHGVLVVVLGSETHFSRFDDAKALAYWALTRFEWPKE